jgi:hypothetical protein
MGVKNLGTLTLGNTHIVTGVAVSDQFPTDIFVSRTPEGLSKLIVTISHINAGDADLELWADNNLNGVLDDRDLWLASSRNAGAKLDTLTHIASHRTYFAKVSLYNNSNDPNEHVSYQFAVTSDDI